VTTTTSAVYVTWWWVRKLLELQQDASILSTKIFFITWLTDKQECPTCHIPCQPQELQFANPGQTLERELLGAENTEGISVNIPLTRRFMQQHPEIANNATNQLEPVGSSKARTCP